jgi:hypothetical protein
VIINLKHITFYDLLLDSYGATNCRECQSFKVLSSTSIRSIWSSYQRLLLLSKISKSKRSEKERCTFRGARDSALFHHVRKEAILLLHKQEKNTWLI